MLLNKPRYINVAGSLIDLDIPKVMGILNVTTDSFYSGSRYTTDSEILHAATKMMEEGAAMIDVGGYSSRPGASDITESDEKARVLNAVKLISRELPEAIISVDTFRSSVAYEAVTECGAHIVNDISGGEADGSMFEIVSKLNVPYIMMHMQGDPERCRKILSMRMLWLIS